MSVLFVCLGNICRSPTAEAVFRHLAAEHRLAVVVGSAGTSASHRGEAADPRSQKAAERYSFKGIHSKPLKDTDFIDYDLILAMDKSNERELLRRCPAHLRHKIRRLTEFHPQCHEINEVPDPYYGGPRGFSLVLDIIEQSCFGLLHHLLQHEPLSQQ
jgi:protein-tyrosine phosphatase